ncbi:MAG TPA: type II and III secretion system protein family protein [Micavibrio sp.]|nr:type II and III secretion system protein family protein [Micavibrio sp.]
MKRTALLFAAIAMVIALPHARAMDKGDLAVAEDPMIDIMLGKAEMVSLQNNVSDVLVANPSIVDVMAVKANQLYLVGSALGDTNIMVLDEDGNVLKRINIHVQMDTRKLERTIKELYPNETVNVKALTDQIVLTGHVSTPAVSNSIASLVANYAGEIQGSGSRNIDDIIVNMLTVAGEQQVMLKVKILEASRSALKDLGLETRFDGELGTVGTALTAAAGVGLTSPVQLGVLALNYTSGSFGPMSFLARALEEEGIVNTLAEPNLTSISGEQAGFLAGGEIPIPTEIDRNGNLIYEFRPFGVSLNFRPTVMSESRISLQMTTEVSNATFDDNLQLQGVNVPTFNVRRADTTVELPSGGTLMIAGLLQSDSISALTQIPGVAKVPVVGDLLKSDSFQRNESELVVMITPYLVKPFAQNAADPTVQKTSAAGDLSGIPRLSMADLEEIPEDAPAAPTPARKMAMAPPTGLSQQPMMQDTPLEAQAAQPEREKNALSRIFESNIKRTYGSKKVDSVMKDMGSFGYITD